MDFAHLIFGFVSVFEFRVLIYSSETQQHSPDYVKNFWDTTLAAFYITVLIQSLSKSLDSTREDNEPQHQQYKKLRPEHCETNPL